MTSRIFSGSHSCNYLNFFRVRFWFFLPENLDLWYHRWRISQKIWHVSLQLSCPLGVIPQYLVAGLPDQLWWLHWGIRWLHWCHPIMQLQEYLIIWGYHATRAVQADQFYHFVQSLSFSTFFSWSLAHSSSLYGCNCLCNSADISFSKFLVVLLNYLFWPNNISGDLRAAARHNIKWPGLIWPVIIVQSQSVIKPDLSITMLWHFYPWVIGGHLVPVHLK